MLLILTLTAPRSRICDPAPDMPLVCITCTPGALACSIWLMSDGGDSTSLALIWAIELPTSRRRAWPAVPVTTISSNRSTLVFSSTFAVVTLPAMTARSTVPIVNPMRSTRICVRPAGTLSSTNRPSSSVRAPILVPTTATWAPASGSPLRCVTRPSMVPVCALAGADRTIIMAKTAAPITDGAALRSQLPICFILQTSVGVNDATDYRSRRATRAARLRSRGFCAS